ncbi:MAG: TVP38/TMEM64 family protein, partial [Syntrophales bacterium LBB04]|nr:TVP38/TMEM64 family protein [Syntrophales bacterium LBB04]
FIVAGVWLVRSTPPKDHLTGERLGLLIERAGWWAPVVFMAGYAAGTCVFVPGTLMAAIGAAIFGPYLGFVYVWIGAMLGASLAFFIGRGLGRDFAASLVGDRLRKYDQAIARNGFAAVLYLRLIYFPFNLMNFGMGLTGVGFRDYFFGTGVGILVGTFLFTFFFGTLGRVWAGQGVAGLWDWKVFFSLALFVFSFFIPWIVKRVGKDPEKQ